jgi:hypothetical protein
MDKEARMKKLAAHDNKNNEKFKEGQLSELEQKHQNRQQNSDKLMETLGGFDKKNHEILKEDGTISQLKSDQNALLNVEHENGHNEEDKENNQINIQTHGQHDENTGKGDGLKNGANNGPNNGQNNGSNNGRNGSIAGKETGLLRHRSLDHPIKDILAPVSLVRGRSLGYQLKDLGLNNVENIDPIWAPKSHGQRVKREAEVKQIEQFAVDEFFDENVSADDKKGECKLKFNFKLKL